MVEVFGLVRADAAFWSIIGGGGYVEGLIGLRDDDDAA